MRILPNKPRAQKPTIGTEISNCECMCVSLSQFPPREKGKIIFLIPNPKHTHTRAHQRYDNICFMYGIIMIVRLTPNDHNTTPVWRAKKTKTQRTEILNSLLFPRPIFTCLCVRAQMFGPIIHPPHLRIRL